MSDWDLSDMLPDLSNLRIKNPRSWRCGCGELIKNEVGKHTCVCGRQFVVEVSQMNQARDTGE